MLVFEIVDCFLLIFLSLGENCVHLFLYFELSSINFIIIIVINVIIIIIIIIIII